jgi:hypothetical protein
MRHIAESQWPDSVQVTVLLHGHADSVSGPLPGTSTQLARSGVLHVNMIRASKKGPKTLLKQIASPLNWRVLSKQFLIVG